MLDNESRTIGLDPINQDAEFSTDNSAARNELSETSPSAPTPEVSVAESALNDVSHLTDQGQASGTGPATNIAVNATAEVNTISQDIAPHVPPTTSTSAGLTEELNRQGTAQSARRDTVETDFVTFVNSKGANAYPDRASDNIREANAYAGVAHAENRDPQLGGYSNSYNYSADPINSSSNSSNASLSEMLEQYSGNLQSNTKTGIGDGDKADFGQEYSDGFSSSADEDAYAAVDNINTYEANSDEADAYAGGSGGNGNDGGSHGKSRKSRKRKQPKGPVYVTRRVLVACLILAMIISTALGAGIGILVGSKTTGGAGAGSSSSIAEATGSEMTISEIIDKNENSVVEINTKITEMSFFGSTEAEGAGSGVIVSKDGYIATNFHVIEDSNSVSVTLHNGEEYDAKVVGYDSSNDIAILKIDANNLTPATYGSSAELNEGDTSVAIGNPLGQLGGTATTGVISALDRSLEIDGKTLTLLQTDAAINPGNSGGGLFNAKGELIGIVVAKSSGDGVEGLGFAIPIDTAKPIIEDIIENGGSSSSSKDSGTPAAGVTIVEVTSDQLARYNVSTPGVYIAEVKGTNAQKAGMKVGDRVVTIDETPITDSNTMIQTIQSHKVGDEVTFTVERDGQQLQLSFELESSSQF